MLADYGTRVSPSISERIKRAIYQIVILALLAVIARDFHLRDLQEAENTGYRNGWQNGQAWGKASCPLPRV